MEPQLIAVYRRDLHPMQQLLANSFDCHFAVTHPGIIWTPLEPAGSSNFRLQLHQPKAPGCCRSLLIKVRPTPGAALCSVFGHAFLAQSTQHTTCSIRLQFASHLPFNLLFCPFALTFGNGCLAGKQNRILLFLLSLRAGQETRSKAHSQLDMSD